MAKGKVTRTNYGVDYNRESMYETAREMLLQGKEIEIKGVKCTSLINLMIEDWGMEMDKESKYVEKATQLEQLGYHDEAVNKFAEYLDINAQNAKIGTRVREGLEDGIINNEYEEYIKEQLAIITKKIKNRSASVEEIKDAVDLSKKLESMAVEEMYDDTVSNQSRGKYAIMTMYSAGLEALLKQTERDNFGF